MAKDKKLLDFIEAYQDLAPETADLNPLDFESREEFLKTVKDYRPSVGFGKDDDIRPSYSADDLLFALPEDYEYMPLEDRAKYYGYANILGGNTSFDLDGVSAFQTKGDRVASTLSGSDYGSGYGKKKVLREKYADPNYREKRS